MAEEVLLNPELEIQRLRTRLELADELAMAAHKAIAYWICCNNIGDMDEDIIDELDVAYKRYLGKKDL